LLAGRDEFSAPAEVRGVVNEISIIPGLFKMESYGAFIRFLVKEVGYKPNTNLLEFAYDWRQDIRISARQLADSIRTWRSTRANPAERVTIIAHSMGGLVARYYLHHYQGAEAVERILFLGTPHRGSTRALALAVAGRGLLPFGLPSSRVKNVVCGFASLYQLLPMYDASFLQDGREFAPFSDDDWAPSEYRHHLETAVAFRRELDQDGGRLSIPHTCIFGYGQSTLARLRLQRDNRGSLTLNEQFFETTGDVAVLESSAALDGAEIHPVCQQHGALYADQDVRRRLQFELLERPRV
jgi:pimeloyl-ACP methyl ester carboxylesterase